MNDDDNDKIDTVIRGLANMFSLAETVKAEASSPQQEFPIDYTETERVVAGMLTESTGVDICDSGGAYGRYWQKNRQVKDFRTMPILDVEVDEWDDKENGKRWTMSISLRVFHFLTQLLEYDRDMDREFEEFCRRTDSYGWYAMEEFVRENHFSPMSGDNTYNFSNILDQVIQYIMFRFEGQTYVIVSTHNGCDVRGGYSTPKVFAVKNDDYDSFEISMNDLSATCEDCDTLWESDDCGYTWHEDGGHEIDLDTIWETIDSVDQNGEPVKLLKHKGCTSPIRFRSYLG